MLRTITYSRLPYRIALGIMLLGLVTLQLAFHVGAGTVGRAYARTAAITIKGTSPADGGELLLGSNKSNNIIAGAGNDYLVSRSQDGAGDVLVGGQGNDTFNTCSAGPGTDFIVAAAGRQNGKSHYTVYMRPKKDYVIGFDPKTDHVLGCDHMNADLGSQAAFPYLVQAPFPGQADITAALKNLPRQDGVLQVNGNATSLAQKIDTGTIIPVQGTLLAGLPVKSPLRNFVWTCVVCAKIMTGAPNDAPMWPTQMQPGVPELPDYPVPLDPKVENDIVKGTEKVLGGTSTDVFSLFLLPNQVDYLHQLQNPKPPVGPVI